MINLVSNFLLVTRKLYKINYLDVGCHPVGSVPNDLVQAFSFINGSTGLVPRSV